MGWGPWGGDHGVGTMGWGPWGGDHGVGTMGWGPWGGDHGVGASGWGPRGEGFGVGAFGLGAWNKSTTYNRMVSTPLKAWVKEIPQRASAKHYNKLKSFSSMSCLRGEFCGAQSLI